MGAIGGLLGTAGGAAGSGFASPQSTNIQTPVTNAQADTSYWQNQTDLNQQQGFVNALQAQNGIGNQSSVFNQLQGVANGQGPNPAQAMLNQATGQNVANQAALMAGQRGANANVGLLARQAAMQGGNLQQQAAGQAATQQANQSLGALGQLGGIAGQQVSQQQQATQNMTQAQQNEQQNLLNAISQSNNAKVGLQSNINSTNAGLAQTQMQGNQNLIGNITGGIGSALGLAHGGRVGYYDAGAVMPNSGQYADTSTNNFDTVQAAQQQPISAPPPPSVPQPPMYQQQAAITSPALRYVPNTPSSTPGATPQQDAGPKSIAGKFFNGIGNNQNKLTGMSQAGNTLGKGIGAGLKSLFSSKDDGSNNYKGRADAADTPQNTTTGTASPNEMVGPDSNQDLFVAARGGLVPALVSPGEKYLSPKDVDKVKKGTNPMNVGEHIPGKEVIPGPVDNQKNDIVKKTLQVGGLVLPKSVTKSKHPHREAMKFVKNEMKKGKL